MMLLTEYETTVVVRPDVAGEVIESTLDRVRDAVSGHGGKLLSIDHWGKKKLAYPIKKHARGVYVRTQYLGASSTVAEVERNLRITDNVLRFLTVQLSTRVNPDSREISEYVVPDYHVEQSPTEADAGEDSALAGANGGEDASGEAQQTSTAASDDAALAGANGGEDASGEAQQTSTAASEDAALAGANAADGASGEAQQTSTAASDDAPQAKAATAESGSDDVAEAAPAEDVADDEQPVSDESAGDDASAEKE